MVERQTPLQHESRSLFLLKTLILSSLIPLAAFGQVLGHPGSVFFGMTDDPSQTMWFIGWFWHAVMHGMTPMFSHEMNYPYGVNFMANSSDIAEAVLFGPLKWVLNVVFAYNVMMFMNLYVTGVMGAFILVELGVPRWLAELGGIIFQVIPYTSAQMVDHANLAVTMWIFGGLYVVLRATKAAMQRYSTGAFVLGLLLAAEFYTSVEIFATLAMVTVLFFALFFIFGWTQFIELIRRTPKQFIIGAVVWCIVLISPGLIFYVYGPNMPTTYLPSWFNNLFVTDLATFIVPSPIYLFSPTYWTPGQVTTHLALAPTGNFMEQDGYVGLLGICLFMWAAWRLWKTRLVRASAVLVLCVSVMSMGTHLHVLGKSTSIVLPWGLVAKLPLIGQALPSRLMFFADFVIVLVILAAFGQVVEEEQTRKSRMTALIGILALLLTWLPVLPFPVTTPPTSLAAMQSGGVLDNHLKGQPTLVITDDFGKVMLGLAESDYNFSVPNFYAYQNDAPAAASYRTNSMNVWPAAVGKQSLDDDLASQMISTRVTQVLVISTSGKPVPGAIIKVMSHLCGKPIANKGVFVWSVPKDLPATYFTGDVWNTQALFDSEITGKPEGVGQDWTVSTKGQAKTITITALPATMMPGGIKLSVRGAMNRIVSLSPGQSKVLAVDPNQTIAFHASSVYDPKTMSSQLDAHPESVLVSLSKNP